MPKALIFGMGHYLVDLNQVCSNYSPRAKSGPVLSISNTGNIVRETTLAVDMDLLVIFVIK